MATSSADGPPRATWRRTCLIVFLALAGAALLAAAAIWAFVAFVYHDY